MTLPPDIKTSPSGESRPGTPYAVCTGVSMYPTLKVADVLTIKPCQGNEIRPGDVALFREPNSGERVVHRIVTIDRGRITTRGDNNDRADSFVVGAGDLIGKVVAVGLGERRTRVHGGFVGRVVGRLNWTRRDVMRLLSKALHGPYRMLARRRVFTRLLSRRLKPRIVCYNRPRGVELRLFVGNRPIGVRRAARRTWEIDRPFRVFIDESKLPDAAERASTDTTKHHGKGGSGH
ncbi:MAG: signal peptidase I [Desulfomonilaceae bacterium]|nr:signal peptidase I [Desulfomonilaceae bacterium]